MKKPSLRPDLETNLIWRPLGIQKQYTARQKHADPGEFGVKEALSFRRNKKVLREEAKKCAISLFYRGTRPTDPVVLNSSRRFACCFCFCFLFLFLFLFIQRTVPMITTLIDYTTVSEHLFLFLFFVQHPEPIRL